jgi:hypothetical protein
MHCVYLCTEEVLLLHLPCACCPLCTSPPAAHTTVKTGTWTMKRLEESAATNLPKDVPGLVGDDPLLVVRGDQGPRARRQGVPVASTRAGRSRLGPCIAAQELAHQLG